MDSIAKEFMNYGVLGAMLLAILTMIWKAGSWIGTNVIMPMKDRLFAHFDDVDKTFKQQTSTLQGLEAATKSHAETLVDVRRQGTVAHETWQRIATTQDTMAATQNKLVEVQAAQAVLLESIHMRITKGQQ